MFPSVCLKNRYSLKLVISAYFNYSANAVFLLTKLLVRDRKLKISVKKKKKIVQNMNIHNWKWRNIFTLTWEQHREVLHKTWGTSHSEKEKNTTFFKQSNKLMPKLNNEGKLKHMCSH